MVVDYMLRDAAICGDEGTFRRMVHDGEDANPVIGALILGSPSFDTFDALCARATAPGRLSILSFLLENHCLSLYTLNASHSALKGLTPLGMATYLNQLDFVTVLLERGDGLVLVDRVDSQRATPIMYAAREGHTDVLRYLIRQGAKITSVDCHHRSVFFYATAAPQCLWECELNLRLQRAQSLLTHGKKRKLKLTLQLDVTEYNTLACLYQRHSTYPLEGTVLQSRLRQLVTSIASSDLSALQRLLFPLEEPHTSIAQSPVIVNLPDENGWSPIHYCVTSPRPSTAILDALYLAGADLSLYTADNTMTPLHALARFGGSGSTASFHLYTFIVHLVRDLGAPLDAIDLQGETCIHIAARYGRCADILMAFLECDTVGSAANIRNNDGQTAYEVARPEFRSAFDQDDGSLRPGSAASFRTIRPTYSLASLGSSSSCNSSNSSASLEDNLTQVEQFPRPISREKEYLRVTLMDPSEAQWLLKELEHLCEKLQKSRAKGNSSTYSLIKGKFKEPVNLKDVQNTHQNGSELLELYRRLIDAELDDLHAAQDVHSSLEQLVTQLEERVFAEEEEKDSQTPTPSALTFRRSETPSLVASGSTASLASLADFATLVTPVTSPRNSLQIFNIPKLDAMEEKGASADLDEEEELDFACALAAGSVTRQRRASALSAIFALGNTEASNSIFPYTFADPNSPLEDGVNLVSIPPARAPHLREIVLPQPSEAQEPSRTATTPAKKRGSWLDPFVRRANSDILKAHLANLLEIEQMLFGAEDMEMEETPSPGSVSDENDEAGWGWREGVDSLHDEMEVVEEGDFLDMFGDEDEGDGCCSARASTVRPAVRSKHYPSTLDILRIARREVYAVEEAMLTACRSIETAQRYVGQAERLTSDIFQKIEQSVQAMRLKSALNNLQGRSGEIATTTASEEARSRGSCSSNTTLCVPSLFSSPVAWGASETALSNALPNVGAYSYSDSHAFPLPPSWSSLYLQGGDRRASKSTSSLVSPPPSSSPSTSPPCWNDDIKWLRHLLIRKIPIWLDATAYDVDKASSWVGILQGVVNNVQSMRV